MLNIFTYLLNLWNITLNLTLLGQSSAWTLSSWSPDPAALPHPCSDVILAWAYQLPFQVMGSGSEIELIVWKQGEASWHSIEVTDLSLLLIHSWFLLVMHSKWYLWCLKIFIAPGNTVPENTSGQSYLHRVLQVRSPGCCSDVVAHCG